MRLRDLAASRVRYGYRRLHVLLLREGFVCNHKLVYRLYKQEGLELRMKKRRRKATHVRFCGPKAVAPNERWSMDFMSDRLESGQRFRVLTIVDHFSRVSPALVAGKSITGKRVVEILNLLAEQGLPKAIHVDNGPEFVSRILDAWAYRNGVKLEFSRPGKPVDNTWIEAFNARLRAECLSANTFGSIEEAQEILESFRIDYNEYRPHSGIGYRTPSEYLRQF